MPALAAVAGALTLAFACTSARAGAATRQASAFDLTVSSPLAVIATIERREPGAGRGRRLRAQVTAPIAAAFPTRCASSPSAPSSDPPALAEGRGYLLFLGEVPTQSLWRAFRSDARARHLADSTHALALDPVIAPAVARALRDFARAVKDDPTDARRLDQLAAHLASGPELLRREAAIGLAARPSPLRPWLDDAKLGRLGRWLGDAGGDPALRAAVVRAFTEGRATRAAAPPSSPPAKATQRCAARSSGSTRGSSATMGTSAPPRSRRSRNGGRPPIPTRAAVMELAARLGGAEIGGLPRRRGNRRHQRRRGGRGGRRARRARSRRVARRTRVRRRPGSDRPRGPRSTRGPGDRGARPHRHGARRHRDHQRLRPPPARARDRRGDGASQRQSSRRVRRHPAGARRTGHRPARPAGDREAHGSRG